jgi:hypothetical protein
MNLACLLWLLLVVSGVVMAILGARMRALADVPGMTPKPTQLRLEFAGTPDRARKLMIQRGEIGRIRLRRQIRLDFFFILAYACAGAASALLAGQVFTAYSSYLGEVSSVVAWSWGLAAVLDLAENAALLLVLSPRAGLQPLGTLFATVKWVLVFWALAYVVLAIPFGLWHVAVRIAQPVCRLAPGPCALVVHLWNALIS